MTPAIEPADAPFGMTDLEERFQAEDGKQLLSAVLSRLAHIDAAIGAMVGRGLSPAEFRRAQAIRDAVVAARGFLSGAEAAPSTRRG